MSIHGYVEPLLAADLSQVAGQTIYVEVGTAIIIIVIIIVGVVVAVVFGR